MSPRTGRPKVKSPLTVVVKARISVETDNRLNEFCKKNNVTRTQVVRMGVEKIIGEEK